MASLRSRSHTKVLVFQEKNSSLMIHPGDLADFHMYKVSPKTLQSKIFTKALPTKLTTFSIKTFLEKESNLQIIDKL